MKYVANKKFTMQGTTYLPGDEVNVEGLAEHKLSQFLNQRIIRPSMASGDNETNSP